MKKIILFTSLIVLSIFLYVGCKKTDENLMPLTTATVPDLPMDSSLVAFFNSLEIAQPEDLTIDKIVLPNGESIKDWCEIHFPDLISQNKRGGAIELNKILSAANESQGPQVCKMNLISALYIGALSFVGTNLDLKAKQEDGTIEYQKKYAYVWNSKEINQPNSGLTCKCTDGSDAKCDKKLYGLDCSGYFYQIFKSVGMFIPKGNAELQATSSTIQNAYDKFWSKFLKIKVKDTILEKGVDKKGLIQSGDILGYYSGNSITHIGWAYKDDAGNLALFQSNGGCKQECKVNRSDDKGPVAMIDGVANYLNKMKIKRLRFVIDISGEWQLHGKCIAQNYEIINTIINISNSIGNNKFRATGEGEDYAGGGGHFTVEITGDYDEDFSTIKTAQMNWKFANGNTRIDNIPEINLTGKDETPFLSTTCISGCACPFEVRLVNNSK